MRDVLIETPRPSVPTLFAAFLGVGMLGFGGVLPLARRMLVERRGWLSAGEFNDLLALCQFLPGGNIINMSVAVGLRFRGVPGALACLVGLLAMPVVVVIALGAIYARFADHPTVRRTIAGLAAAAAGLVLATAAKIAWPLRADAERAAIALTCCVAIGWFRAPLLPTMAVMAPLAAALAWRRLGPR